MKTLIHGILFALFTEILCAIQGSTSLAMQESQQSEPAASNTSVEIPDDIRAVFEGLGKATEAGDDQKIEQHFSIKHLAHSAFSRGILNSEQENDNKALLKALEAVEAKALGKLLSRVTWNDIKYCAFEKREDGTAEVFIRHWDDNLDAYNLIRWWLINEKDIWQVFDFEDLDLNLRLSSMLAIGLVAARDGEPWVRDMANLVGEYDKWQSSLEPFDDIDGLIDAADDLLDANVPDEFRSFLLTVKATSLLQLEDGLQDAASTVEEMKQLAVPPPITFYLHGIVLNGQEQYEQAIAAFEKYAGTYGWDATIHEAVSDSWWGLGNRDKAIEHATNGLQDTYRSWGCVLSLALALPSDRKKELDPWLEKHSFDEALLESIIDWCLDNDDEDGSLHVFRLLKKHHPESELIEYYNDIIDVSDF